MEKKYIEISCNVPTEGTNKMETVRPRVHLDILGCDVL